MNQPRPVSHLKIVLACLLGMVMAGLVFGSGLAIGLAIGGSKQPASTPVAVQKPDEPKQPERSDYKTVSRERYTLEVPESLEDNMDYDEDLDFSMSNLAGDVSLSVIVESTDDYEAGTSLSEYASQYDEGAYDEGWERLRYNRLKSGDIPNPQKLDVLDEYALIKNQPWLYSEYTRYIKTDDNFYVVIVMIPPSKEKTMHQDVRDILASFVERAEGEQST